MTRSTARTAVITAPRAVEVRDEPVRAPGEHDLLIANRFSGISAGTEMNVYRGSAPQWRSRQDSDTGLFQPTDTPEWTYPMAYGYAAVGEVRDVGPAVTGVKTGDLVFTYTPHSEIAVVGADEVIVLPALDDLRIGVLTANVNTALNGVLDAHPNLGDAVVVSGLGVIGLLVTQLMRRAGAGLVIGVDGVAERRKLAEQFGADVVLAPSDGVAERVRELTGNRGADLIVEVSGASPALNEAIRTVGYNGTVIAMSWYGGTFETLSLSGEFHHNRPRIISSQVGGVSPALGPLWSVQRRKDLANDLLAELDLQPLLTHTLSIEQAGQAYALVDSRPDDLVQCVLEYPGASK